MIFAHSPSSEPKSTGSPGCVQQLGALKLTKFTPASRAIATCLRNGPGGPPIAVQTPPSTR